MLVTGYFFLKAAISSRETKAEKTVPLSPAQQLPHRPAVDQLPLIQDCDILAGGLDIPDNVGGQQHHPVLRNLAE